MKVVTMVIVTLLVLANLWVASFIVGAVIGYFDIKVKAERVVRAIEQVFYKLITPILWA